MSSAPSHRRFTYDFSIWYSPADEHVASRISERLRREGFQGYLEHQDQVAGTSVIRSASEAMEASRVAILLFSTRSLRDPWCQRVSQWNLHRVIRCRGTKVIPVCVGVKKAQVPPFLQHLTELQYQAEFFFDRLLGSLRTSCPAAGRARPGPAPES